MGPGGVASDIDPGRISPEPGNIIPDPLQCRRYILSLAPVFYPGCEPIVCDNRSDSLPSQSFPEFDIDVSRPLLIAPAPPATVNEEQDGNPILPLRPIDVQSMEGIVIFQVSNLLMDFNPGRRRMPTGGQGYRQQKNHSPPPESGHALPVI